MSQLQAHKYQKETLQLELQPGDLVIPKLTLLALQIQPLLDKDGRYEDEIVSIGIVAISECNAPTIIILW